MLRALNRRLDRLEETLGREKTTPAWVTALLALPNEQWTSEQYAEYFAWEVERYGLRTLIARSFECGATKD